LSRREQRPAGAPTGNAAAGGAAGGLAGGLAGDEAQRNAADGPERRLAPRLGVWSTAAILIGVTIGSGIFRVPAVAAGETGALGATFLLWVVGGLVALFGALTIAELAAMYPRAGGIYVFLREAYGPEAAFLFGWTRLLVIQPAVIGAIALICASYVTAFVPLSEGQVRFLAIGIIVLLAATSYRSLAWGAAVQNVSTVAKVAALLVLAGAVFVVGDPAQGAFAGERALAPASWGGFGIALLAVMWTYDGWIDATYVAEEVRDPGRTLPRALAGGVLVVITVYLLVNAAYLLALPLDDMAASSLVAADAARSVFGPVGASLVAALVILSTFGALNGVTMTGPRVFFAMARDDLFFRPVAAVHPSFGTPHVAIALAAGLGIAYVSFRTFEQLAEAFVLGIWPFYVLCVIAVFLLRRRRPGVDRPYRAWGYPWVPVLFLLASLAMLGNALVRQPASTLLGFAIILSGIPAYRVWVRLRARRT
jgi:basic amino acid/polyamine antiporter, APA family